MRLLIPLLLLAFSVQAAPSIDELNSECVFNLNQSEDTGVLGCDVTVYGDGGAGSNVFATFFGPFDPKPENFSALSAYNLGQPCFFVNEAGEVFWTMNVWNIVQPLRHADLTQFVLHCVNLQPLPF